MFWYKFVIFTGNPVTRRQLSLPLTANPDTAHVQEAAQDILSHILLIKKETGLPGLLNTDPHSTPDPALNRQRN